MHDWVQNVPMQVDTTQLSKFKRRYFSFASKDGIIWKFRSVNCQSIIRPLKQLPKVSPVSLSRIFVRKFFLEIIIKVSVTEFVLSKIPLFQHILMNTFRRIRLKYETYFLRRILF